MTKAMTRQIADAATQFQFNQTARVPESVTVVKDQQTPEVTLNGALSSAEKIQARTGAYIPAGATQGRDESRRGSRAPRQFQYRSSQFRWFAARNKKGAIICIPNNTTVGIYHSHTEAEEAVKELQRDGFDLKQLSIVGKDYKTEEHVVGYYNAGDRIKYWGKLGAFWGGIWCLLFGSAFFFIPGIGPLVIAGPLVAWIVGALEGAVVTGGLSALGAGLYSMGIPKNSMLQYETAVRNGEFVLVFSGTSQQFEDARHLQDRTKARETHCHMKEAAALV